MKSGPKIALEEWLAEMQRLSARSDEGLTAMEWAAEMGVSHGLILQQLKLAQGKGWLKVGRRQTTTLDGKPHLSPVYQIVKPKAGKTVPKSNKL